MNFRGRRGGGARINGDRPDQDEFISRIKEKLEEFLHSGRKDLRLEPMNNRQRATVNILCRRYDLRGISEGTEPNRFMVITRASAKSHLFSCASLSETQSVNITTDQKKAIRKLIGDYPIEVNHVSDHLELADFRRQRRSKNAVVHDPMKIPPVSNASRDIESFRRRLPTFEKREQLLNAIRRNQVTLITGGTGCGKTTQVPQFLLEEAAEYQQRIRIICTQPRRLPAIAVSERVAKERGERLGGTIGYHIRLEQKTSEDTILTYCTSGVLLRMLTADALAHNVSHIILDEIHEREQNTDYLLIALKQALKQRNDLKVILMSATMEGNKEMFLNYFENTKIGHIEIPSRLYDVDKFYLPDILAMTGYMPSSIFGGLFQFPSTTFEKPSSRFPRVSEFRMDEMKEMTSVRTAPDLASMSQIGGQWNSAQPMNPAYGSMAQHSLHPSSSASALGSYDAQTSHFNGYNGYGYDDPSMQYYNAEAYDYNNPYQASNPGYMPYYDPTSSWSANGQPTAQDPSEYLHQQTFNATPSMAMPAQPPQPSSMFYLPNDGHDPMASSTYSHGFGNTSGFGVSQNFNPSQHLNEVLPDRPRFFDPTYMQKLLKARLDRAKLVNTYLDLGGQQWAESVDPDFTAAIVKYCMDSQIQGSILVFLPGYEDILSVKEKIQEISKEIKTRPIIHMLHSQISSNEQQKVFEQTPKGSRKVILSTNIAEASLTIDDVVFVIDGGKVKEKSYDAESRISQLRVQWIAKSNAEQRAGRAGRCRNGFCFRLYSKEEYNDMNITQVAEMKRAAIHEVCLHAKMFAPDNVSVRDFLHMAPEPPTDSAVDNSLDFLEQLGALYTRVKTNILESEDTNSSKVYNPYRVDREIEPDITELGRLIAHLPLEPNLARLLLFGLAFKCLSPILSLVASLSHREPFILPMNEEAKKIASDARDEFARRDFSDHLMMMRAFYEYCKVSGNNNRAYSFCQEKFLSFTTMKMIYGIRGQLWGELKRLHLVPHYIHNFEDPDLNMYSDSWPMVQAAILAGCYPGIGFVRVGSKMRKIRTRAVDTASLHPSSVIKRQILAANKRSEKMNRVSNDTDPEIEYLAYQELAKIDEGLTLRMVTAVTPITVLLFAGPIRTPKHLIKDFEITEEDFHQEETVENHDDDQDFYLQKDYIVELEPWLAIKGKFEDLQLVMRLRFKVMSWFLAFLKHPTDELSREHSDLLESLNNVLRMDHRRFGFPAVLDLPKCTEFNRNRSYNEKPRQFQQYHQPQQRPNTSSNYDRSTYDKPNNRHELYDDQRAFNPTLEEETLYYCTKTATNGYSKSHSYEAREPKDIQNDKEPPPPTAGKNIPCAGVAMLFESCKISNPNNSANHHQSENSRPNSWGSNRRFENTRTDTGNSKDEWEPSSSVFSSNDETTRESNGVHNSNYHHKQSNYDRGTNNYDRQSSSNWKSSENRPRQWGYEKPADRASNWRSNDARIDSNRLNFTEDRNAKPKVFYRSNVREGSASNFRDGPNSSEVPNGTKKRWNRDSYGTNRSYEDQAPNQDRDRYEKNDRPRGSRGGFVSSRPTRGFGGRSNYNNREGYINDRRY